MIHEFIPIDYLSDHLDSFEIGAKFISGEGYLAIIRMEDKIVYQSESYFSEASDAFKHASEKLTNDYLSLME
jgi:hypothetical protein